MEMDPRFAAGLDGSDDTGADADTGVLLSTVSLVASHGTSDEEEDALRAPRSTRPGRKPFPIFRQLRAEDWEGAEATLAEKIRDLKQLHEQGVLDDDEFKSAKAKLLR